MQPSHPLVAVLSEARLSPYRTKSGSDIEVLARYLWNLQLCESLYPSFHILEVALRNRLDHAITTLVGTNQWYTSGVDLLHDVELRAVESTITTLQRKGRDNPHAGQIVAGMTFGFWTSLFKRSYEHQGQLWPFLLREVLPGMPRTLRTRVVAAKRFDEMRRVRNRAFHHEPIWNRDPEQIRYHLLEAIEWVSPDARQLVESIDRSSNFIIYDPERAQAHIRGL